MAKKFNVFIDLTIKVNAAYSVDSRVVSVQ